MDNPPSFSKLFNFKSNTLINFVGGGGKTILIHKLMEEFVPAGHVLYTTTTRIHPPVLDKNMVVVSAKNLGILETLVVQTAQQCTERHYKIVATRQFLEPDLLHGVPVDFLESMDRSLCVSFLNEADGSARFSLKLPRDNEPVLMKGADYLVPVIGMDCLHKAASPETIFRLKSEASKFDIQENDCITPELAAKILMHPKGVCKDWEEGVTIIPFINKVDTPEMDLDARALAEQILQINTYPVNQVVWGSVRFGRCGSIS